MGNYDLDARLDSAWNNRAGIIAQVPFQRDIEREKGRKEAGGENFLPCHSVTLTVHHSLIACCRGLTEICKDSRGSRRRLWGFYLVQSSFHLKNIGNLYEIMYPANNNNDDDDDNSDCKFPRVLKSKEPLKGKYSKPIYCSLCDNPATHRMEEEEREVIVLRHFCGACFSTMSIVG